jgi:putative ABC transport system permease protein
MVVESLALAVTGGAIGVALGWGLLRLTLAVMPDLASQNAEAVVEMNVPVLLFGLAVALFSGVLAGCAPAWHAMRLNLGEILKQSARSTGGGGRMRTQRLLVISEFALALTLLAGAAMTLRSFYNLTHVDLGVQTGGILTSYMTGPQVQTVNPEKVNANARLLLSSVSALPGVQAAALSTNFPLQGHDNFPFSIEGQPVVTNGRPTADLEAVSPGFFSVFRVQLLRGRIFADSDDLKGRPVAMVSEGFTRRYLPGRNPLEARLVLDTVTGGPQLGPPVTRQIVGVFRDVRNGEHLSDDIAPEIYLPAAQMPFPYDGIAVRTVLDPLSLAQTLRTVVGQTMPGVSLVQMQTMQASLDTQLKGDRFSMLLFGAFALLALGLSALGIYGVIAFSVTQRQHEMGLRVALGAKQREMLWLVLKDAMHLCLYGTGFGLLGAVALGRVFHSALFGIGTVDLGGFAVVAALLTCVALLAAFVPALRSSRTDPMVALRQG